MENKIVKGVYCFHNKLTELIIPEGVKIVSCEGNNITHLSLPNSIECLWADKEITGLEKHIGTNIIIKLN